jgi:hypothetical protein
VLVGNANPGGGCQPLPLRRNLGTTLLAESHGIVGNDGDLITSAFSALPDWCAALQPRLHLTLQLESITGEIIQARVREYSRLIYEQAPGSGWPERQDPVLRGVAG